MYSSTMRLSTLCGLHRDTEQPVRCEHGDGLDQLAPAPATRLVAHVGSHSVAWPEKKQLNIFVILCIYVCINEG